MSSMTEYACRAETPEKKALIESQWFEAHDFSTIHCQCGQLRHLMKAYRCLYCGLWLCTSCAEKHFGMTIQEWIEKKRVERVQELERKLAENRNRYQGYL